MGIWAFNVEAEPAKPEEIRQCEEDSSLQAAELG
jgi:hypothetical protein